MLPYTVPEEDRNISAPYSVRRKIFFYFLFFVLPILLIIILYGRITWSETLINNAQETVLRDVKFFASMYSKENMDTSSSKTLPIFSPDTLKYVKNKGMSLRLTHIDNTGLVLADTFLSKVAVNAMDSHINRPEIRTALNDGQGNSIRHSTSTGLESVYAAILLPDGSVLRASMPYSIVNESLNEMKQGLLTIAIFAFLLCIVLAILFSIFLQRHIKKMTKQVENISRGTAPRRIGHVPLKDFIPLAKSVNTMSAHLETQMTILSDQTIRLEGVLESIEDGVLLLDTSGRIVLANKALMCIFPELKNADGKQVVEVLPLPSLQNLINDMVENRTVFNNQKHTEKNIKKQSWNIQLNLSDDRVLDVSINPFSQNSGYEISLKPLLAVATFHDITKTAKLERIRKDFVANVSHELRTPLTVIQGYAETLSSLDDMPETGKNFAQIIQRNGQYLYQMVEDLLVLSRLEQEEELLLSPAFLSKIYEATSILCEKREKQLQFYVDIDEQKQVIAHFSSLVQVLRNILENAYRYAPEKSIIRIFVTEEENTYTMVVTDEGSGIPKKDLSRIFERFYRVEKHRSSSLGASTGLGLSICKHSMDRMKGSVWAQSPYVMGDLKANTAFFVRLPKVHK